MGDESHNPREEAGVNTLSASYSLDNGFVGFFVELYSEVERYWTTSLDFRLKLCVCLVIWLIINSLLIKVAWSCYGDSFRHMYMKTGSSKESEGEEQKESHKPKETVREQHLHRE